MNGEKHINYTVELTSADVNKLIAEFVELFLLSPGLKDSLPNIFELSNMMNRLLGRQDYNPTTMDSLRAQIRNSGLKDKFTPALAPVKEAANEPVSISSKKPRKAKAESAENA